MGGLPTSEVFIQAMNLAGLPAMSVPVGVSDGLPLGMHMVAPYLQEARLLGLAHQFQTMSDWHGRAPVAN
jgi:aspartyl-tRNA(Asn)/glutamyl-tRNA(Gln) amidotransferase subunit A